jgi:hypothetical protein
MKSEIRKLLETYHSNTLWDMAQAGRLEVTKNGQRLRKSQLLPLMEEEFFTPARIQYSLSQLDKRERAVLNQLLQRDEPISTNTFRRQMVRAGLVTEAQETERPRYYSSGVPYANGYTGTPHRSRSRVFEDVIARLTYHGLVFSQGAQLSTGGIPYKLQYHPGNSLYVPEFVRRHLPEAEQLVEAEQWQPERIEAGVPAFLLRDLYLYWDFVRQNEVPFIQAGFVGKRPLKAINELLLVPDPLLNRVRREDETQRLFLLRQLLEALDLVYQKEGYLHLSTTDSLYIPAFWTQSSLQQLKQCVESWPRLEGIAQLGSDASNFGPHYAHARQVLLDTLKDFSTEWFEVEELLEHILLKHMDFLFPEHSRIANYHGSWYHSYSGNYYYGSTTALLERMEKLEAQFIKSCLTGFLHQAGVVDLGYEGDKLQGFRLSAAGRTILTGEENELPEQEQPGKIIVQPNFQLMAIGPVGLDTLARLDLFAERENVDRGVFEYHLSRESIYQAQQLGVEVSQVVHFLEQAAGMPLPQNVQRSLSEWAAHYERIIFRSGVSLIQTANAELLERLAGAPDTADYLARPISDEVALVLKDRQQELIAALVERGLFPAVSGGEPEAADDSVIIEQNGHIRPIHAVPSLHLRGRLSRVAEQDGEAWQLTQASVRRAGGSKRRVLDTLKELRRLHRGPFPEPLVEQVKAWGGYYGPASVEDVTLIELRDVETLAELREQHPELKLYLTPFPAGDRALVVVSEEHLERVREILAQFGVLMKEGLKR